MSNEFISTIEEIIEDQKLGKMVIMVDDENLPENIIKTHVSLFDGSLQGFEIKDSLAFGFQGHPEASPGPNDIKEIFGKFIEMMDRRKNA